MTKEQKTELKERSDFIPIKGFEKYLINRMGQIISMKYAKKPRFLSCAKNHCGYRSVQLYKDNKKNTFYVHQLVASHFIGVRPEGWTVDHINSIKTDNHYSNLTYMSLSENVKKWHREQREKKLLELAVS